MGYVQTLFGNAAEHAFAITAAMKNPMDISLSIAIGSSLVLLAVLIAGQVAATVVRTGSRACSCSPCV